jgi:hypothetical protein
VHSEQRIVDPLAELLVFAARRMQEVVLRDWLGLGCASVQSTKWVFCKCAEEPTKG